MSTNHPEKRFYRNYLEPEIGDTIESFEGSFGTSIIEKIEPAKSGKGKQSC